MLFVINQAVGYMRAKEPLLSVNNWGLLTRHHCNDELMGEIIDITPNLVYHPLICFNSSKAAYKLLL